MKQGTCFVNWLSRAVLSAALAGGVCAVVAQGPAPGSPAVKTRPSWNELTPAQRNALSPLAGLWETLETEPKRKWLEVAAKYPKLTPDAQQRVQQRMGEFARLSPEQRTTARENFRRAYELPADERQEKLQRYQELPDDRKRALAEQAARKQALKKPAEPAPATAK